MGRARTAPGTYGKVTVVGQVQRAGRWVSAQSGQKPSRYRARTRYRDRQWDVHTVERFGPTKARAEARLKGDLASWESDKAAAALQAEMTLTEAGELWLARVERPDSKLSDSTRRQYRESFQRHVLSGRLAALPLSRVNTARELRAYLERVADNHGTGSAKTARSVLSNILRWAVEDGALPHNAMRDVRPVKAKAERITARDTRRALTREERDHLLRVAAGHERAVKLDVADIVWFMAGTGVRISEALNVTWHDVDLSAGKVTINGTKSKHSVRTLTMPEWLTQLLRDRAAVRGRSGFLFPSPGLLQSDSPRDRRNVARVFREVLDEAGFVWATPHTLRRTVASLIDAAGLPIALAADVLGHADAAMTARVYLGRRGDTAAAAAVL